MRASIIQSSHCPAALTAGRVDIVTLSIHAEKNFPARKARSTIDVGLPDGTGDADYLAALAEVLPGAPDDFLPELIPFQAGWMRMVRTSSAGWR